MRRAKYKLREPTLFKAFLWLLPLSLAIYIVVMGIVEDAVVEGVGLAVFFAAIFCALNMLYFSMTHRVIFKDHVCDVRFHRTGHFIPYAGVTSAEMTRAGEISVKYHVELGGGRFTSYALPVVFRPEEPERVLLELRGRVEAAKADRQRIESG